MSSYATYCRDQATDCTRRARLARSTDIAAYYEGLGLRWLRLAEHAQGTGGVVGQASEAIGASSLRASDLDARHNMHKPQEAISGTLAALRSSASDRVCRGGSREHPGGSPTMVRHLSELPVVRCPGCNRPMDAQERTSVTDRLVDIRYVCAVCGMETKRTVKEDE